MPPPPAQIGLIVLECDTWRSCYYFYIPENVVIYSTRDNEFKEFETCHGVWTSRVPAPDWCTRNTQGCVCPPYGMIIIGSTEKADCQRVELLDINNGIKKLPDLLFPSASFGMAWDNNNKTLIIAGGDQFKDGHWNSTRLIFRLTNVSEENSKWELETYILPFDLASPELLFGGEYLYILCSRNSRHCLRKHNLKKNWEVLPTLKGKLNSSIGHGGAVFINNHVVVFTLKHIMILKWVNKDAFWKIINKITLKHCIPRLFLDGIIVLKEHQNNNGTREKVIELLSYFNEECTWNSWEPITGENSKVSKISLEPWKFFISNLQ